MNYTVLKRWVYILLLIFLVSAALYLLKEFLIPFLIAAILAMLLLPIARRLEKAGLNRGFSAFIAIVCMLMGVALIVTLLSWQLTGITEDAAKIEKHITETGQKLMQWFSNKFGVSVAEQKNAIKEQQSGATSGASSVLMGFMGSLWGFAINFILVVVYIFLLLISRLHLKNFMLKLVKTTDQEKATCILSETTKVAQKYLGGLCLMIIMLWILYGIGFSVVGVKSALFFAVLCGILELVPFVGNLTGTSLTVLMAISQGGGTGMVLGVIITYAIVQFVQSYILEPLVVGAEVNINPLFTIVGLVIADLLWGIPGMVLAIPLLGILKIICDNIEGLRPIGYLVGQSKNKQNDSNFASKIKGLFIRNQSK